MRQTHSLIRRYSCADIFPFRMHPFEQTIRNGG